MDSLRYHNLDKLLELCSSGRIDMHEPIEVLNQSQTHLIIIFFLYMQYIVKNNLLNHPF